ncbi:Fasciclin-like arabinogalactan protein 11 [Salvia divinorum]|uniref:Fasciclin-like arabinogalactan protein 11 n=1 Tax=Salvia divinorum TaxID=28513 RepID=A0ABD1GPB2_SALDI
MKPLLSTFPLLLVSICCTLTRGQSPAPAPAPRTSKQGVTLFAPTDSSFSDLKPRTLNSFTDEQKVELLQFHVLPSVFSTSQFQTASNPMRTQAGSSQGSYTLNVTVSGNQVNITTGVTNATVASTVYTDSQLAVYQVDHVLLQLSFFVTPSPSTHRKAPDLPSGSDATPDSSHASVITTKMVACGILFLAAFA